MVVGINMHLEFRRMSEINNAEYVALHQNPLVRRQMPLTDENFGEKECQEWVAGKEKQWEEYGYGPWAFIIDGKFAGWGGLQYENGDADVGLVLHPDYWRTGKIIYEEIIKRAFGEMKLESVTILFPPTRTRIKGILRLGFQADGEVEIEGQRFIRYRLFAPKWKTRKNKSSLVENVGAIANPQPNTACSRPASLRSRAANSHDIKLKYGCNPHQTPASFSVPEESGFTILSGTPSYINILDALGAWQLARELKIATGKPGAASFKHTSPAGAAIGGLLPDTYRASQFLAAGDLSPVASAYVRARGGDRMCSFGDAAAVSDVVDASLARVLKNEVSDLIIAPGFEPEALEILKAKKQGQFLVMQIDPAYEAPASEFREVFGFGLRQGRNTAPITKELFRNMAAAGQPVLSEVLETLIVATIALKYTQSNAVCVALDGQVIGMGAGQQSRVHCTRLACDKADKWLLQQHPGTLGLAFRAGLKKPEKANIVDQYLLWDQLSEPERRQMLSGLTQEPTTIGLEERMEWVRRFPGICLSSDAYIPFRDNIDRANRSNVQFVAHAGSSLRDEEVTEAAEQYGMTMFHTGMRLFLH